MFIKNNHFCLFWKSNIISFNQVIEDELKSNFEIVYNVISDKHVKSFIKYEYKPEKIQSSLSNIIVYDLGTFNKDRAVLYCSCKNKKRKFSGKYNRDKTKKGYRKCLNGSVVFKGSDCFSEMLHHVLSFKGEGKKSQKQTC